MLVTGGAALVVAAVYLRGLASEVPPRPDVRVLALYTLAHPGAAVGAWTPTAAATAGALGLLAFVGLAVALWRGSSPDRPRVLPWLLLALYAVLTAAMTAAARAPLFGVQQALTSRYVAFSSLFWISLAVLGALAAARARGSPVRSLAARLATPTFACLLVVLLVGVTGAWGRARENLKRHHAALVDGRRCLTRRIHPVEWCVARWASDRMKHYARAGPRPICSEAHGC